MAGKGGKARGGNANVTIIRREEVAEAGHHGGAWKVAYADFVTAMMAFFLLMWLLNATTEDQRKGLADYFSPNNLLSHASSGTGQPFGGHTVFDKGAMVSDRGAVQVLVGKRPVVQQDSDDDEGDTPQVADAPPPGATSPDPAKPGQASGQAPGQTKPNPPADPAALTPTPLADGAPVVATRSPSKTDLAAEHERQEKQAFTQAAEELRQAVRADPALAELSRQLAIDITPEGLRIQLLDEEHSAMFTTGSATPNERAQLLLGKVAQVLRRLPEEIAVVGHTDATPFAGNGRSNWELSTERANATRRLLVDAGLGEERIRRVTGLADRDPLLPADPFAAANRRIAIIVLRGTKKKPDIPAVPAAPPATTTP
jgi:chemotaxis protein MotB